MKTSLPWRFDTKFILNIHIRIRYSNNYHRIALFVFVFVLILRTNTIRIRIRFIFRKQILFVFVFVPKLLFVPTLQLISGVSPMQQQCTDISLLKLSNSYPSSYHRKTASNLILFCCRKGFAKVIIEKFKKYNIKMDLSI